MEQRLDVVVSAVDGATFVQPVGVLDIGGAAGFENEVLGALGGELAELVMDLRGVSFLDSIGLRSLFRAWEWCNREHVALYIVAGGPPVQRILRVTGADAWLPVVEDVPARLREPYAEARLARPVHHR